MEPISGRTVVSMKHRASVLAIVLMFLGAGCRNVRPVVVENPAEWEVWTNRWEAFPVRR